MKKVAISIGDINGIGIQIALNSHKKVVKLCKPIYCINDIMLKKAASKLNIKIPYDFITTKLDGNFKIKQGKVSKKAGQFSFLSFTKAVELTVDKKTDALVTLPINKLSWNKANINYKGHTEYLRDFFKTDAIMMIGVPKLFVSYFTEHIPLKQVTKNIKTKKLVKFLLNFENSTKQQKIVVLGVNPHAGDGGILGDEDIKIAKAIKIANKKLNRRCFIGPLPCDTAFAPFLRKKYSHYVSMYHDQTLGIIKALYFKKAINVTLNIPIIRASVDHGTAYDIAYKNKKINTKSYLEAIKYAINKKQI